MAPQPAMPTGDVTGLLLAWGEGDREALDRLVPFVYEELRKIAHRELRRERPGGTIQTTALVHEAYLRLVDQKRARVESRNHFLSLAAQMMRRVLVDEARRRGAGKRGANAPRLSLEDVDLPDSPRHDDLVALDDALTRLEQLDPSLSRLVEMRYFGGLSLEESADVLRISKTSAWRDWQVARAWLYDALAASGPEA
jgi:RNA polymerase sigma factor (TIGR02999 family)